MLNFRRIAISAFAFSTATFCAAQTRPAPAPAMPPAQTQAAPVTVSSMLQPSLDVVVNTLNGLNIDKWKKGTVRQEAADHVNSILRDIQTNLPPLLAAADAAPGSLSAAMPLVKHLDALYDVLLRVEEGSRVAAPSEQVGALQQALVAFGTARFALDDSLQKQAATQEKQVSDLRAALTKATVAAQSTAEKTAEQKPCVPPKPAHRRRRTKTAAKKPQSTPAKQKPQSSSPQKPQ